MCLNSLTEIFRVYCMYVLVCVHMCVHVSMEEAEVFLQDLLEQLDWLLTKPGNPPVSAFSMLQLQETSNHHSQGLQTSCLHGKHFTYQTVSSALSLTLDLTLYSMLVWNSWQPS